MLLLSNPTFDYELSLGLEVFGSEFDLARLQQVHIPDGESVDSTCHTSFHLDRQEIRSRFITLGFQMLLLYHLKQFLIG